MITIDLGFQGLPGAIAAFLIPGNDGPVLIETGPHSTLHNLKKGIEKAGYQLSEIKHVLLSHIHLDHAGAAWYFAKQGARVYVHFKGYNHLHNPQRLITSARRIYGDDMDQLWGQMQAISKDRLVSIEDEKPLHIGGKVFKPWFTPGHAKHHIAWQLEGTLFTGDVAGVKIAGGPVLPPCPPPDIDIKMWIESLGQVRRINPDTLQLTHFGKVENIDFHLGQLEERLYSWSNWIKPYWESQTPASAITDRFRQYVSNYLIENGLSESQVETYEMANPTWMSVYGIMRYWEQKSGPTHN